MPPQDANASNLAANTTGGLYEMYTPIFGNVNFQIQPSTTGKVSNAFGTVPYVSLESIIYSQGLQAQTTPVNMTSGQNTGQQNIQGSTTIQDSDGLTRMVMGYSAGSF